jgi:hypothetical protein
LRPPVRTLLAPAATQAFDPDAIVVMSLPKVLFEGM